MLRDENNEREKTHDQERAAYTQQIIQKEKQLDKLREEKQAVERLLYQLEDDFRRGYQSLRMLNDENARDMQTDFFQAQQRSDDQERRFRQQVQDAQEQFSFVFKKEILQADDECEEMYKKRGEISWD
ncbi:hypothetical protein HCA13_00725 [Listeria seeligeri]|nr:hypothetical protein [Listeria seeligeri]MBC1856631.1 hypothetical protein [Listeria seeligeri]